MEVPFGMYGLEVLTLVFFKGFPLTALLVVVGALLRGASPRLRTVYWAGGLLALGALPILALHGPAIGNGPLPFPGDWVQSNSGMPPIGVWAVVVWGTGAAFYLLNLGRDVLAVWLEGRSAEPWPEPAVVSVVEEGRSRLGIRRAVRVRRSRACRVPLTYGWLRPVILLPATAAAWPRSRLRAVVHHELAHIAGHDAILALLEGVVGALHWPNPLLRRIASRLRADQEMACDASVVRDFSEPAAYARHLVGVARSLIGDETTPRTALPLARHSTLRDRVRFVLSLDRDPPPAGTSLPRVAASGLLVVLLTLSIAFANPWRPCESSVASSPDGGAGPAPPTIHQIADLAGPSPRS